ncbi:hypothetical protein BaRGS_00020010 [Batillaria attramentaria]|uniref:Uncharacterized protein n=1 Tax=Batillaria attramentaria TaxID=370345 RepID=A0ABD0KP78_9CAEN
MLNLETEEDENDKNIVKLLHGASSWSSVQVQSGNPLYVRLRPPYLPPPSTSTTAASPTPSLNPPTPAPVSVTPQSPPTHPPRWRLELRETVSVRALNSCSYVACVLSPADIQTVGKTPRRTEALATLGCNPDYQQVCTICTTVYLSLTSVWQNMGLRRVLHPLIKWSFPVWLMTWQSPISSGWKGR